MFARTHDCFATVTGRAVVTAVDADWPSEYSGTVPKDAATRSSPLRWIPQSATHTVRDGANLSS